MGPAPLFAHLLQWLGWAKKIDEHVGRDSCKVSVGTRIEALLINIATDRAEDELYGLNFLFFLDELLQMFL